MTATTIRVQMAQRKDTAANWTAANPILLSGEIGYETDTEKFKIGDGTTNWNSLAYLPIPDGSGNLTITGNLEIGTTGTLTFEGSTADGFETTLAVTDPTADRTITLPNVSGTVVTTGDTGSVTSTMIVDGTIVDADVSATAEIAVSKLANGTANQVIVTDGTNVSWSDDLTLAGNLTVNGTTTTINTETLVVEDKNIELGVVDTPTDVTADGGGITLKGTTDKTINWVDATDAWTSSERFSVPLGSAAAPSLTFTGDTNTGIYSPGADQLALSTNGTGRLFVDSSGRVGIGTTSPSGAVHVENTGGSAGWQLRLNSTGVSNESGFYRDASNHYECVLRSGEGALSYIKNSGSTGAAVLQFFVQGGERARIDSSGKLLIGSTIARANFSNATTTPQLQVEATTTSSSSIALIANGSASASNPIPIIYLGRSRGTLGTNVLVNNGDALGSLSFQGNDGSEFVDAAYIRAFVDGTAAADEMPGRLAFFTTAAGASSPTERMRIDSSGRVGIGTTNPGSELEVNGTAKALTLQGFDCAQGTNSLALRALGSGANSGFLQNNYTEISFSNRRTSDGSISTVARIRSIAESDQTSSWPTSLGFYVRRFGSDFQSFRLESTGAAVFQGPSSEFARIDSSGKLLVGTSSALGGAAVTSQVQVLGTDTGTSSLSLTRTSNNTGAPFFVFVKSRGADSSAINTIVQANDAYGGIKFAGADGIDRNSIGAAIDAFVDGTPGANDMPGRLVFSTTADGASSPTERLRITSDGVRVYNQPAPAAVNATATLTVANLKAGIITSTSAAATDMTLPTGTLTEGGFSGLYDNFTFEWSVINTGPSLVRVLAATAHTIVGSGSVVTGTSARFASRRTAANTFVSYRLS